MSRFTFKLQPLLTVRQSSEKEKQRIVAELERHRMSIEGRLRTQQAMIVEGRDSLRGGLTGPVDAIALRFHAASTMRLMRDAQRMAVELATVHRRIDEARADLAKAAAARRAIELLRDRRFAEWKHRLSKQEAAALDELAVTKAARQQEVVA